MPPRSKSLLVGEGKCFSNEMENKEEGVAKTKSFRMNCPWSLERPNSCWQERTLWLIPNCSLGVLPGRWFFFSGEDVKVQIRSCKNSVVGWASVSLLRTGLETSHPSPSPGVHVYDKGCNITYQPILMAQDPKTCSFSTCRLLAGRVECLNTSYYCF